ncbi:MAG: DUF503 domain-containing protein [Armatimonadetes bacterium]|nr:DUF503 domain-containing protein [Armatimonadota bacterium]
MGGGKRLIVGVLRAELALGGTRSLKDKRRIIQSLLDRARREFRVAAAEVELQESWRRAVLGFACVSSEGQHASQILSRVAAMIERESEVMLVEAATELL